MQSVPELLGQTLRRSRGHRKDSELYSTIATTQNTRKTGLELEKKMY